MSVPTIRTIHREHAHFGWDRSLAPELVAAPDETFAGIPPRSVGGNMDVRDLGAGTTLYLPVEVENARLSLVDTHAAQGDGEVCGTAIERAMDVMIRVPLLRDTALAFSPSKRRDRGPAMPTAQSSARRLG